MQACGVFKAQTRHYAMLVAGEPNNATAVLCLPRAIAAPSSGQYWLLNRTMVLSPIVLLCKMLSIVGISACWHLCSSLGVQLALIRPEDFSGSPLWSPNLRTIHPQSWPQHSGVAALWQVSSPMTSVYDTARRVSICLVRLHACREDGRVRASLDASLLSALLGVISFRSTVDVSPRDIAPHHERQSG